MIIRISTKGVNILQYVQIRTVVNVPPTATGKRRFRLPVETDPHKLVNYCCGLNYHIDEADIKLKPDEDYPEWLWQLRMGPKKPSYMLEKGTEEYYLRLAEEGKERNYSLKMKLKKPQKIVGQDLKDQEEYLKSIRFRALAYLFEEDAGLDSSALDKDLWIAVKRLEPRQFYLPKNPNQFLYADKIVGSTYIKNFKKEDGLDYKRGEPRVIKTYLEAKLDKRQRHMHSVF